MNKNKILKKIKENRETLKNMGLKQVGLFGSYSRSEANEKSDIDLLIEFLPDQKNYANYMRIYDFFELLFQKKIDLITKESVSPYIYPYIESEIVYEKL